MTYHCCESHEAARKEIEVMPEGEDEYDWSIKVATTYHNNLDIGEVSKDNAEANEPSSRNESEFTFI